MFKKEIINVLAKQVDIDKKEIEKLLEVPPDEKLGDYAFPCFSLAGKFKKNPAEIAKDLANKLKTFLERQVLSKKELANKLKLKTIKEIEKIEQVNGYVNFFINKKKLAKEVISINANFGKGKQGEKILLEHTSVNPNASPHVGRTRNSIIGDSIKRILQFSGNRVETHYYINDVSKQIAMLALTFRQNDSFDELLKRYVEINRKIEKNPKIETQIFGLLHKFEHKDKKTTDLFKKIVEIAVKGQKKLFSELDINFDYFDYESRYLDSSKRILKELENTGKLFKDKENRMVLNQAGTGLEQSMKSPVLVLTRSDGTGLYPLRDLAYTIDKGKKGRNIIVLGEDQKLYFEQLKQALILLKKPYPEVVHYSFVLLRDAGKMSTRRGELVLLSEFLAEALKKAEQEIAKRKTKGDAKKIAVGAIKYSMLRNENNKNIIFDWQQALNFEGDSGPYLQYAYARASSILKKAKIKKEGKIKIQELSKEEINLIKKISEFPDIVQQAGKQMNPSLISNYSFQLAQIFNEFYHNCRVIGSKEEAFRLKLVQSFRTCMKNSLYLLGIETMEEM